MNCKCMESVAAGWCTMKWLRFDKSITNLTSSDLGIPLVVIQLRVTGMKKARSCISYTCLRERRWGGRGEGERGRGAV